MDQVDEPMNLDVLKGGQQHAEQPLALKRPIELESSFGNLTAPVAGHFNDAVLTVSELEARPQVLLIGQCLGAATVAGAGKQ
eukprot:Skav214725  [mRNA]  locus=scaffold2250:371785:372831:+ [translate_table: standard]